MPRLAAMLIAIVRMDPGRNIEKAVAGRIHLSSVARQFDSSAAVHIHPAQVLQSDFWAGVRIHLASAARRSGF